MDKTKLTSEELESLVSDGTIKSYDYNDQVPYDDQELIITFNNGRKLYIESSGCRSDQSELRFELL